MVYESNAEKPVFFLDFDGLPPRWPIMMSTSNIHAVSLPPLLFQIRSVWLIKYGRIDYMVLLRLGYKRHCGFCLFLSGIICSGCKLTYILWEVLWWDTYDQKLKWLLWEAGPPALVKPTDDCSHDWYPEDNHKTNLSQSNSWHSQTGDVCCFKLLNVEVLYSNT